MKHFSRCFYSAAIILCIVVSLSLFHLYVECQAQADESAKINTAALYSPEFLPKKFKSRHTHDLHTELGFNGVHFDPDAYIIDDLFHIVEFKRVRENISMGVTRTGLKFCIDW